MKKFLKTFVLCAVAVLAGYLLAGAFFGFMKPNKNEKGYVGPSEIKIENGVMTPEALLAMGRLSDPQVSPNGEKVLYGMTYTDVKQNKSCRNLFLSNLDGSQRVQLTRYASSVSCARWAPDGKSIYFLQDGQIWNAAVGRKSLGARRQISNIPSGISEFKLSPDGSMLLYISTVPGPVKTPKDIDPALDKAQAYVTEDLMYRHWDHWVTETPRTYIAPVSEVTPEKSIDILGSEPYELPTEPFGGVEQLDWSPSGRLVAYSCRKHTGKEYAFSTNCGIYIYDLLTGETIAVKTDGGYDTDPVWSEDGQHLAWISMERDGYEADRQRILVASVCIPSDEDGQSLPQVSGIRELTSNYDNDASSLVWHGDEIYFSSMRPSATQAILKIDLEGHVSQITKPDWKYDFFSPWYIKDCADGGVELYSTYYCLNFPVEMVKVDYTAEGKASFAQTSHENAHILDQMDEPTSESIYLKTVDGKQMQCWMIYPPHFDKNKTYPAIEIVLGGPQGTNSQDWSYRWCYRLMAQQGYIVILPNRRGTTAFGQEWKEQISGDYPGLNMQDYLTAGRYVKSLPYVGKLACVGASYGGYSVYMLEGLHGDLYDCFIAHAGIFNERQMWFTTEEMWFANWDNGGLTEYAYTPGQIGPKGDGVTFGGMQQAGAPYASTPKAIRHYAKSPETMVTNWHTPILCIHGMMDFRIPYEQGMAAFNAAQMMGVPSKLVIFPEENHWILRPQNSLLWHKEFFSWMDKWCR